MFGSTRWPAIKASAPVGADAVAAGRSRSAQRHGAVGGRAGHRIHGKAPAPLGMFEAGPDAVEAITP